METKKIIKELEAERKSMDANVTLLNINIDKINKIIDDLKCLESCPTISKKLVPVFADPKIAELTMKRVKPKRKYNKTGQYKQNKKPSVRKRRSFPPEVLELIKENLDKSNQLIAEIIVKKLRIDINSEDISKIIYYRKLKRKKVKLCQECASFPAVAIFHGKEVCNSCYIQKKKKSGQYETEDNDLDEITYALDD